jgi:hypothetical protein
MIPSLTFISSKFHQVTNGFVNLTPDDMFQGPEFGFYAVFLKKFLHKMCNKIISVSILKSDIQCHEAES